MQKHLKTAFRGGVAISIKKCEKLNEAGIKKGFFALNATG